MQTTLVANYRRTTIVLFALVVVICPIFYFSVDRPVAEFVRDGLSPESKKLAGYITGSGDLFLYLFAVIAIVGLLIRNMKLFKQFLFPLLAAAAAGITANILKVVIGRWRPEEYFKVEGHYGFEPFSKVGYAHASMPSGHSAAIMASMTAIAILFPRWRVPCFIMAALIGSTRLVLSAHYPGDIFAGLVLGYLCAVWLYYLFVHYKLLPKPENWNS